MVLLKEGQVYPVPPSLLPTPSFCLFILVAFVWFFFSVGFFRFIVVFGR